MKWKVKEFPIFLKSSMIASDAFTRPQIASIAAIVISTLYFKPLLIQTRANKNFERRLLWTKQLCCLARYQSKMRSVRVTIQSEEDAKRFMFVSCSSPSSKCDLDPIAKQTLPDASLAMTQSYKRSYIVWHHCSLIVKLSSFIKVESILLLLIVSSAK